MVRVITASNLRQNLKKELDLVCTNHETLLTTRLHGPNVVVMSEEDYKALNETAYLLGSEENKKRLIAAINSKGKIYNNLEALEADLGI